MPPPPASSLAEEELADLARTGDEQALGELYQRHSAQLYRHAWRMLRDEAAAGDAVHEAFARAIAAIPRTRERLQFKAWMFRIVTNLCLRELTLRTRLGPELDPERVESPSESPDEQRHRGELAACAADALEKLPPRYRQILLLREVEGLEYEELARVLELSLSMVKVTLHRARARFRALVIAEQLLGNPGLILERCEVLGKLAQKGQGNQIERHLQSCPRCKQEHPPVAALVALLPPPPTLPPPLPPGLLEAGLSGAAGTSAAGPAGTPATGPLASPGPLAAAGASAQGVGAWVIGLTAALGVAGVVTVATLGTRAMRQGEHTAATRPTPRAQPSAVAAALAREAAREAAESSGTSRLLAARSARAPRGVEVGPRRRPGARAGALVAPSVVPQVIDREEPVGNGRRANRAALVAAASVAKAATRSQAAKREVDSHSTAERPQDASRANPALRDVLRMRVEFAPGSLFVERGGRLLIARKDEKVRLGDVLLTRNGISAVLRFPEDQWLVLSGRLRLESRLGPEGAPEQVQVTLLSGEARAKATARGRGILIRASQRVCVGEGGEFRVRETASGLRVEALTAYVKVSGPHASRVLPRGTGVLLATTPGFAHVLPQAPERLRPVLHRGAHPPTLTWEAAPGATSYLVRVAVEPNFWVPDEEVVVKVTRYRPQAERPGRHFWQVIPLRGVEQGYPSKVYAYTIER